MESQPDFDIEQVEEDVEHDSHKVEIATDQAETEDVTQVLFFLDSIS